MPRITAYNLVRAISCLPRNRDYNYVNERTSGRIRIMNVEMPAGPIIIRRWDPNKGQTCASAKNESISSEMIWRLANAISENDPINVDRAFAGSYNTRSVLEALVAHTPEFYYCYPGRIMDVDGHSTIEHGHKHLLWTPSIPHENGVLVQKEVQNMAVSEIPVQSVVYDNLELPETMKTGPLGIEVVRRHTQIQIALYLIGLQLGYRTWIAQNDMGICYQGEPLINHQGIISSLSNDENLVSSFHAEQHAKLIDCIWFKNSHFMPAVMEVEHTTGVTSGLNRMLGLYNAIPALRDVRYVIVAPDEDRDMVIEKINRPQFRPLEARYFAYSSVEELYYICTHRNLHGVTQDFLDCYMERVCYS